MPKIVFNIIMWLIWLFVTLLAGFMAHFLTGGPRHNTSPFDVFVAAMFLTPAFICAGLRFWLSRIRNPWLAFVPFCGGLFFAWQTELFGIFLFPNFYKAFQVLSAVLFLVYLPVFVKLRQTPPPLPIAHNTPQ
jgi:hypothetical protein